MINKETLAGIKTSAAPEEKPSYDAMLKAMSQTDLRRLQSDVEKLLPSDSLSDMDMPKELMRQYHRVKLLQDDVMIDNDTPVNQKAQVAGQVASTLQQLTKMQTEFYNSERFRNIENLMIKFLKGLPLEQARDILLEYEALDLTNG